MEGLVGRAGMIPGRSGPLRAPGWVRLKSVGVGEPKTSSGDLIDDAHVVKMLHE